MPPTGVSISPSDILLFSQSIGGFLMILGGILGVITIILSGIMYLLAASNQQRVKTAKDALRAGIIGSLIIFSSGAIINVIKGLAQDPLGFFR
jgi:cell shape-determining protein MreD